VKNPVSDRGFASRVHEAADALQANELFQANGWTDGLPIPPWNGSKGVAVTMPVTLATGM
jgi:hypothetical protein